MASELDEALRTFEETDDVRAIVISWNGQAFSAGIDVSEHGNHDTEAEYETWVARMEAPFLTLGEMATPVVAAPHGHAAANGLGLVAACDLAVAADGTQFGATAPKVGLCCMSLAVPLRETMTRKRCLELLLTDELIDADTARSGGLVNRVVPADEHVEAAMDLAETIASTSPIAVQMGKELFYDMADDADLDDALARSNERFADLCTTDAAHEGIAAFLDGDPLTTDE